MKFKILKKRNVGLLPILPWWIGLAILELYPSASSLIYSLHDHDLFRAAPLAGLNNYKKILGDPLIMKVFVQTFKYTFLTAPLELIFALSIIYILNFKTKGVNFLKTAHYTPSILGGPVFIMVSWRLLFKTEGLVNTIGSRLGIQFFNWPGDPTGAFWVIMLLRTWQFGSPMVIFLAALKGVSQDLYEAAFIDGAGRWKQFFSITIPLITPAIFYNFVTQLYNKFRGFNGLLTATQGGPPRPITLASLLVYNNAFKSYEMGMASAAARLLFLIIVILTAVLFPSQRYWVYYSDEDGR